MEPGPDVMFFLPLSQDHTTLEVLSRLMSQSLGETAASHTQRGTSSFR